MPLCLVIRSTFATLSLNRMKNKRNIALLIGFIFISYSTLYSQTNFHRGFNSGWDEGYCYDSSSPDCIPPSPPLSPFTTLNENKDSFKDGYLRGLEAGKAAFHPNELKFTTPSTQEKIYPNSRKSKYDYEVYKPDINTIALQVLADRSRSRSRKNSYSGRKEWVLNKAYPQWKKAHKLSKNVFKERKRDHKKFVKKIRKKSIINLNNIKNGWYLSYTEIPTFYEDERGNFLVERFVQVVNGNIVTYLGKDNAILKVLSSHKMNDYYMVDVQYPDGYILPTSKVWIYGLQPAENLPEINELHKVIFYLTKDNGGGKVKVYIDGHTNRQTVDTILSDSPNCSNSKGEGMLLIAGNYNYFAYNDQAFWHGSFEVKKGCIKYHLITD